MYLILTVLTLGLKILLKVVLAKKCHSSVYLPAPGVFKVVINVHQRNAKLPASDNLLRGLKIATGLALSASGP